MGDIAKDWLVFMLVGVAGAVLPLIGLSGTAAAATQPEYSLSASPNSISWPDAPDFQYRLEVNAGTEPLDLNLKFPGPGWGYEGVDGSVFGPGSARLEGPGELTVNPPPVPAPKAPAPGYCVRGVPAWFAGAHYELKLAAGASTTLILDASLTAAPLPATKQEIRARLWTAGVEPTELSAPITIGGQPGVLIRSRFQGAGEKVLIKRAAGQRFRLTGETLPPLANRVIQIARVEGRFSGPGAKVLGTVRTDANGKFKTKALQLKKPGIWTLRISLAKPGEFDPEPSCAGAVGVRVAPSKVTVARLTGHTFVSTRVTGRSLGKIKVRLSFSLLKAQNSFMPKGPFLAPSTGCNSMGGPYTVRAGRLRLRTPIFSTEVLCRPNHDRWLLRLLRKGMKAQIEGKRLTLTRGKTRIVLRQTS